MASPDIRHGDCLDVLRALPDASVDSIVTDPPYELGFMGKRWDASGIAYSVEMWRECLRVLRPGGHLASFGGTRTYHRMACAVEDAGFEIRDSIGHAYLAWVYGSGFPKSLDVGKAIDRQRQGSDEILDFTAWVRGACAVLGLKARDLDTLCGTNGMGSHWMSNKSQPSVPTAEQFARLRPVLGDPPEGLTHLVMPARQPGAAWEQREVIGERARKATGRMAQGEGGYAFGEQFADTAPATDAARQWQGFGTALKPAWEPIVLARKPLVGTVAVNVLAHGTGALNIDATRVAHGADVDLSAVQRQHAANDLQIGGAKPGDVLSMYKPGGRWPANVLLSHGESCGDVCQPGCPVAELDAQSGIVGAHGGGTRSGARAEAYGMSSQDVEPGRKDCAPGASRFFPTFRYQAKAPTSERPKVDGVSHPTVKPLTLLRWLVRLVTPPGGTILDPFAGSGTTVEAALLEGFDVIAVEREADYLPLIAERVARATPSVVAVPAPGLFDIPA